MAGLKRSGQSSSVQDNAVCPWVSLVIDDRLRKLCLYELGKVLEGSVVTHDPVSNDDIRIPCFPVRAMRAKNSVSRIHNGCRYARTAVLSRVSSSSSSI